MHDLVPLRRVCYQSRPIIILHRHWHFDLQTGLMEGSKKCHINLSLDRARQMLHTESVDRAHQDDLWVLQRQDTLKIVKSLHMCLCGRKLRMYVKGPACSGLLSIHPLPRYLRAIMQAWRSV